MGIIVFFMAGFALWLGIQASFYALGFLLNNPATTLVIVAAFFAAGFAIEKFLK